MSRKEFSFVFCSGFLFLSIYLLSLPALADSVKPSKNFECPRDITDKDEKKRTELLLKIQTNYNKTDAFSALFQQESYLTALDQHEESKGTVLFQKPGNMKWHYEKPEEQFFLLKGSEIYFYQVEENQMLIDTIKNILISQVPVAFLMGIGDIARDFHLVKQCEGNNQFILDLKNKNRSDTSLKKFKLLIDDKTYFPKGAEVSDVSGNITSIVFSDIITQPQISPQSFELKTRKNTDIIDKRSLQ